MVINPATDHDFVRRANERAEVAERPEELQLLLSADYPRTRVVRGVTDIFERWYVYRDGHWVNPGGR